MRTRVCVRMCMRVHARARAFSLIQNSLYPVFSSEVDGYHAVSYTHLDVYKRQL